MASSNEQVKGKSGFRGGVDHFDGAGVFGAGFDDEGGSADEALELGAFFEGDGTGAGNLTANLAINEGGGGGDWIEELDTGTFFDPEVFAGNLADDFAVAADDQIAGALDGAGEFAQHGEVVAEDCDT